MEINTKYLVPLMIWCVVHPSITLLVGDGRKTKQFMLISGEMESADFKVRRAVR